MEIYFIVALLPITAVLVVLQVDPYHVLILRGILGAIAALVYTVLGAADVALTEALVGTLLAITLYAVAVRSSLVLRLGILEAEESQLQELLEAVRAVADNHYLRLELLPYRDRADLDCALTEKAIHGFCWHSESETNSYRFVTRIRRLSEIFQAELRSPSTQISHLNLAPNPKPITSPTSKA